jgi:hypothetical protein
LRRSPLAIAALIVGTLVVFVAPAAAVEPPPPKPAVHEENQSQHLGGVTWRVYGYKEGLVGHTTANGHVIQPNDRFVALPCFCALSSRDGYEFQVQLEYNGRRVIAPVWDVGPWNVDDNYWDPQHQRRWSDLPQGLPQAAAAYYDDYNGGRDGWGREITSPGGIDIGDGTFAELGMTGSDWVNVTFLWLTPNRWELSAPPAPYEDMPSVWWDERPPLDWAPEKGDARYGYVWETGHNVPIALLDYWRNNGSWLRFGLPISEFFREVNPDGTIRYVQYFERTVLGMDWSDPSAGPIITSDALGYRTYIDQAAHAPVAPFATTPSAVYFAETGHSLQNGFKWYWETHGGWEVFGAPLSEEWSEINPDGRKVVMQVFERARLEWWPDRVGTGEEITRGLLTVELLRRRGWLE